uniref:Uncharacterized protein n=1 Tax=Myoviridae sp. ctXwe21 TaxID=2825123 RepID=A0A8S5PXN9_9CAUD|nr:MAG TPA: hypothetical protein [Myoviridae sp. ctXwe21]
MIRYSNQAEFLRFSCFVAYRKIPSKLMWCYFASLSFVLITFA